MKKRYFIGGLALMCLMALEGRMALGMGERKSATPQEIVDPITWNLPESELKRLGYYQKPFHPGVWYSPSDFTLDHFWPRTIRNTDGGAFALVRRSILKAQQNGDFNVEDFEKLDFSIPGEAGYGDNPKLEVFNPDGPFKAPLYKGHIIHPQDFKESTEPDSRVMFVRVRQKFGTQSDIKFRDSIYGVVTNIKNQACLTYPYIKTFVWVSNTPLNSILKPILLGYVEDSWFGNNLVDSYPCVTDSEGKRFYFGRIITVYMDKGETKWRM